MPNNRQVRLLQPQPHPQPIQAQHTVIGRVVPGSPAQLGSPVGKAKMRQPPAPGPAAPTAAGGTGAGIEAGRAGGMAGGGRATTGRVGSDPVSGQLPGTLSASGNLLVIDPAASEPLVYVVDRPNSVPDVTLRNAQQSQSHGKSESEKPPASLGKDSDSAGINVGSLAGIDVGDHGNPQQASRNNRYTTTQPPSMVTIGGPDDDAFAFPLHIL